jgi:hypothetical protein
MTAEEILLKVAQHGGECASKHCVGYGCTGCVYCSVEDFRVDSDHPEHLPDCPVRLATEYLLMQYKGA